jgi:hypothetical protein
MKVSLELRVSWRAWIGDEYAACGMGIVDRSSGISQLLDIAFRLNRE